MNKLCNTFKMLFLLLLYINGSTVFSQSQQLTKHIEDKLIRIDERLEANDYDLVLTKLEELESYKDYISNEQNKLTIDFKKAQAYYGKKEQDKAMGLLLSGLGELELSGNLPKLQILFSSYIGDIFKGSKDYNRSIDYFKESLKISKKTKDTINILNSYSKIGSVYYFKKEVDSAVSYYKRVVDFNVNKATEKIIFNGYNNLSVIFFDIEEYELAEEYGNKSLEILQKQKDSVGAAIALVNLSNILYKQNNFKKVKENYLRAYESVKGLKESKALSVRENVLYNLAYVSEELNDFKNAYYYLEQASNLTDSLARANITKDLSEVTAKFNVEKAAKEAEEEKSKRQRTQYLFYSTIFIFITLLILSYIFYRNYRLKRENELDKVVNETQIKIINATIDAKEQERKSIAETLHDSVSALLSSANLHLQATKAQLKKGYPQEITKAQTIVNEASVKIRDLSHELISSVLLKFGLAFAVHDMCQKYSNSEISLLSDDNGVKRYEQNFEIKIYNIIEELVNNILKHSKASNATIMLAHRENDMLSIRMNDDGIGFDAKKAKTNGGLGLSHIEARIKVMKGVFNIVSSKDNGTSIFILVPIVLREV